MENLTTLYTGWAYSFLPRKQLMKDKNQIEVCDFLLLCASVDNIYDIGEKQYGIITLHYIQGGRIPSYQGRE